MVSYLQEHCLITCELLLKFIITFHQILSLSNFVFRMGEICTLDKKIKVL
jgi:hypothetical protein